MNLLAQAQNPSVLGSEILSGEKFNPDYWFTHEVNLGTAIFTYLTSDSFHTMLVTACALFSVFFITVICYASVRMLEIRKKEHAHLHHEIHEYAHKQHELASKKVAQQDTSSKNNKWNQTLTYLFSQSPSDWKLAIVEADTILEDLLDSMGYRGTNLGEKLKQAGLANFRNINTAWEVHIVRNKIAHEGSEFDLSQREAKKIISKYEDIFRAYAFI